MVAAAPLRLTVPRCCSRHQDPAPWDAQFATIRRAHRVVVLGLVFIFLSGVTAGSSRPADLPGIKVFWTKMALVAALLVNGTVLVRAERQAVGGPRGLRRLQLASAISLALWFLTTLLGTALPNVG